MIILLAILIAGSAAQNSDEALVVNTLQGPVKGYKSNEAELYEFYGIPYATEPRGKDKFKAPLPPPQWTDTFEAVDKNVACLQSFWPFSTSQYAGNCLITNVLVPKTNETNLSVLVYIHGGRYQVGEGMGRETRKLTVEGNIITVNFNYRLGANGFLCLGTENAPGNAGIKDQIALLQWIQNNIANFGGNPNDVTVSGYSAGSSSVDVLLLSKLSQGLFHKAIHESGSAFGWAMQNNPIDNALEFAATLGFYPSNINELEQFYLTVSDEDLVKSGDITKPDSSFQFVPCLENEDASGTAVLTKEALEVIKDQTHSRIPILTGIASQEGLVEYGLYSRFQTDFQNNVTSFLPQDIKISDVNEERRVENILKETYFVNGTATVLSYVEFKSYALFKYAAVKLTRARAAAGFDVYFYEYTFYDDTSQTVYADAPGAMHCAQTNAVTENPRQNISYDESFLSEDFKAVRREMRKLWISFVKNGRPVMEATEQYPQGWPPATTAGYPYMALGLNSELINSELDRETIQIWDDIYAKYYMNPVPPRDFTNNNNNSANHLKISLNIISFLFYILLII